MQRTTRLPILLAVAHLLVGVIHAAAHQQLNIFGSPVQLAYIGLVIYGAPLLALVLLWRGSAAGSGLLLAALSGSFVYGVYFHFIADSVDHVSHLPEVAGALAFRATAVALALCDGLGSLVLTVARLRETSISGAGRHVIMVDGSLPPGRALRHLLRADRR